MRIFNKRFLFTFVISILLFSNFQKCCGDTWLSYVKQGYKIVLPATIAIAIGKCVLENTCGSFKKHKRKNTEENNNNKDQDKDPDLERFEILHKYGAFKGHPFFEEDYQDLLRLESSKDVLREEDYRLEREFLINKLKGYEYERQRRKKEEQAGPVVKPASEPKVTELNNYAREALSNNNLINRLESSYTDNNFKEIRERLVKSINEISFLKVSYKEEFNNCDYSQLVFISTERSLDCKDNNDYEGAGFFSKVSSNIVSVVKHGVLGVKRKVGEALGELSESCKGVLYACADNEVVRTAGYFMQRVGYGLEDSRVDMLNCIKKTEASLVGSYYEPIEHEVHENNTEIGGVREKVGNILQCASRALGDGAAILCAALAVACVVEAALPVVAAGVAGGASFSLSGVGIVAVEQAVPVGESIAVGRVAQVAGKLVESVAHFYGGKDYVKVRDSKNIVGHHAEEVTTNKGSIKFTNKQLQRKFRHAKYFGIKDSWSKSALDRYKKAIVNFINSDTTEVIEALYRKEQATFYINKRTGQFIVKIEGIYRTGWRLGERQLNAFLRSKNLN